MPDIKQSLKDIRTIRSHTERLRGWTPQGALVAMAGLAQERQRVQVELARWKKRSEQMRARLREIRERERYLLRFTRSSGARRRPREGRFAEMTLQY